MYSQLKDEKKRKSVFTFDIISTTSYSLFTKAVVLLSAQLPKVTSISISLMQFRRRKEIAEFLCRVCEVSVGQKCSEKLRTRTMKSCAFLLVVYLAICTFQFFMTFKPSLMSIIWCFCLSYPYVCVTSFISLVKAFELIFDTFMQDFLNLIQNLGTIRQPIKSCHENIRKSTSSIKVSTKSSGFSSH